MQADRASPLQVKKLYVLAAFEVEKAREKNTAELTQAHGLTTLGGGLAAGMTVGTVGTQAQATLQGLVTREAAATRVRAPHPLVSLFPECSTQKPGGSSFRRRICDFKRCFEVQGEESMDRAWRGAEAHHFWMLAHRQLYSGTFRAGLRTALNLRRFDDVLPAKAVYCLLALMALCAGYFKQCSKAFLKLEHLDECSSEEREAFAELAAEVFARFPPHVRPSPPLWAPRVLLLLPCLTCRLQS